MAQELDPTYIANMALFNDAGSFVQLAMSGSNSDGGLLSGIGGNSTASIFTSPGSDLLLSPGGSDIRMKLSEFSVLANGRFGLNQDFSNVSFNILGVPGDASFFNVSDGVQAIFSVLPDGNVTVPAGNLAVGTSSANGVLTIEGPSGAPSLFNIQSPDAIGPAGQQVLWVREFFGSYNLELMEGDAYKPGGGSWAVVSDARLKKNIVDQSNMLDKILKLHPVNFEYDKENTPYYMEGKLDGFLAQEVEKVFPEWVNELPNGYKSLSIKGFESITVQAFKELKAEKDAEISELKLQLTDLEARLSALENRK